MYDDISEHIFSFNMKMSVAAQSEVKMPLKQQIHSEWT